MRVLVITLALGLGSGCGALEELEAVDKRLDQNAGRHVAGSEAEESEPEPDLRPAPPGVERLRGPSTIDRLVSWAEKQLEGPPPPPDPGDALVRCWVGPHEHFTTKRDCESRGGRGYDLPPVN